MGVAEIILKQSKQLKLIYKAVIAKKLGLGYKFPRKILYIQHNSIRVGLLQPETVMAISALR